MVCEPKPNSLSDISCQITLISTHIICLQISAVDTSLYFIFQVPHPPQRPGWCPALAAAPPCFCLCLCSYRADRTDGWESESVFYFFSNCCDYNFIFTVTLNLTLFALLPSELKVIQRRSTDIFGRDIWLTGDLWQRQKNKQKKTKKSPDDGHNIDETMVPVNTCVRRNSLLVTLACKKKKNKTKMEAALKYWFGLSECSCWGVDYFHEFLRWNVWGFCIGCARVRKKMTWHSVRNVEQEGTGGLKKPCSCFSECFTPRSSLTSLSWIWMMLNPWEESCHVSYNCSIGKFLQTDPRTSLDNRASSTGDSVCLHFYSFAFFSPTSIVSFREIDNSLRDGRQMESWWKRYSDALQMNYSKGMTDSVAQTVKTLW